MKKVANIIICHQENPFIQKLLLYWKDFVPSETLWVAYGGTEKNFAEIEWGKKFFISDSFIKAKNGLKPWESYQSYFGVFQDSPQILKQNFDYIHICEYDCVPLQRNLNGKQMDFLEMKRADIIGYHLRRVDKTNYPVYLKQCKGEKLFQDFLKTISVRKRKEVILKMLVFSSFWSQSAFSKIATLDSPPPCFLEISLPTFSHHLGLKISSLNRDSKWHSFPFHKGKICAERTESWIQHPVKSL